MIRKPVTIQNNMDMEDRPVAHLVQEASQYASQVYIVMGSKKINESETSERRRCYNCSRRSG
jgi:catabolite repression HPr-like protein